MPPILLNFNDNFTAATHKYRRLRGARLQRGKVEALALHVQLELAAQALQALHQLVVLRASLDDT